MVGSTSRPRSHATGCVNLIRVRPVHRRAPAGLLLLLAVATTFGWAPTASAATDQIIASPGNLFTGGTGPGGSFSLDAGSIPQFVNGDPGDSHNVVASEDGPDGEELFQTALLPGGGSEPVIGSQYLIPGSYRFICTIHIGMESSLSVAGPGAVPRPAIDVSVASGKVAKVARGKLKVAVKATALSEDVSLAAKLGGKPLASVAGIDLAAGESRNLTLKLGGKARRLLADLDRAKVSLSAKVPFGAADSAKRTLK